MVGEPSARIRIDSPEKCLQRVKKADDQDTRAQELEILGRKAQPKSFASAGQRQRYQEQGRIAPQRQEMG